MSAMRVEDQYHVGIVVDDYEGTLERLTALFGYRFGEEIRFPVPVRLSSGETATWESSFCYSLDAPHLEIVRAQPGTVWVPADSGLHHVGYWSDDVAADAAVLEAQGFVREVEGVGADGPMFTYHRHPDGPRVELVHRMAKPMFEQYWTDGRMPF